MTPNYDAVVSLLGILAIAAIVYGPWQAVWCDIGRQMVFERRDAIFDLAASDKLSFKSVEYRKIRSSLESLIRFAHDLTLLHFLFLSSCLASPQDRAARSELAAVVDGIDDPATRAEVRRLVMEVQRAMVIVMAARSPITTLICLPWILVVIWRLTPLARASRASIIKAVEIELAKIGEAVSVEAERAETPIRLAA